MTTSANQHGIILFAHGSRDALWRLPIEAVALRIQELAPDKDVSCAYLELTTPDLPSATSKMIARGIQHIVIVPMFLGVGRHAREDLPMLVKQLEQEHPQIHFELRRAIGEEPELTHAMANIALTSAAD
jgi:sirohydrochlorin cobaltochelatase